MGTPKIHESEYRFCLIMWEYEPITTAQLVKLCQHSLLGNELPPVQLSNGWVRVAYYEMTIA